MQRVEEQTPRSAGDVPTFIELWRLQLVWAADAARVRLGDKLPAHHDILHSRADVIVAPDDALLEALGFPNVCEWGWLYFMLHNLMWFSLCAYNWNLPHLAGREMTELTPQAQRWAYVGQQFCELMRARGYDPLTELRAAAQAYMGEQRMSEVDFIEHLRVHHDWYYIVYTCESVEIPATMMRAGNDRGMIDYDPTARAQYLAEMRGAYSAT
jgi:hypothetical protein